MGKKMPLSLANKKVQVRINRQFYLGISAYGKLRPARMFTSNLTPATLEQFDGVALWWSEGSHRATPIVFTDEYIYSTSKWKVKDFYLSLCEGLKLKGDETYTWRKETRQGVRPVLDGYSLRLRIFGEDRKEIEWGCRMFRLEDFTEMKELMEESYTKEELGVK